MIVGEVSDANYAIRFDNPVKMGYEDLERLIILSQKAGLATGDRLVIP